ncbi:MAG TPA: SufD family Fe-S cluster assembly protein [Candidatus Thermoplasmatota archaeon]|nr:SufD family Fe-S cluster assembly protein [Candidatus Thermoplasmatota archaeon]
MAATTRELQAATEEVVRATSKALEEPSWMLDDRLAALARYRALPVESSKLFTRHIEPARGLELLEPRDARPKLSGPSGRATFQALDARGKLPAGLDAVARNDLPGFALDKFSNLPRALFTGGSALHVQRDATFVEPFVARYEAQPGAAFARTLVALDAGARATLLVEVAGHAGAPGALGLSLEVLLGEGAQLHLLGVGTAAGEHTTLLTTQARTGDDATLDAHFAHTGGALTRARTDILLHGRGSRVRFGEVVFGRAKQRFDLTTNIVHHGVETTSDALSKAALKDAARANLKGVITLLQEGKDSDSYLQQHAMLLSKEARCIAIPSLEIVNREIKRAKHAATVAQVSEDQIYYLQTRGLSEDEARKTIVLGFLGPLLDRLGEARAEALRSQIEATWA